MADAGYRLAVEGEKEFKKALAEIQAAVKTNKSELKLLTAEYEINDDKLGNLTGKYASLEKTQQLLTQEAELQRTEYEKLAAQYGETDEYVLKLKESLNKTLTEQAKNTAEMQKTQKAMEEYSSGVADMEGTIRGIDAAIEANRSEMQLLDAQYKGTAEQSEKLQKQNLLLEDSVEKQKEKIAQLEDALNRAKEEYGEGSEAVSGYTKQLAEAKTELIEMEGQIDENNDALRNSGDSADPLKDALSEVADKLGIDIPPGIENMSKGLAGAVTVASGIAVAVKEGLDAMKETAAYADDVLTESIITGIDTTTYQQLKYMEGLMDVSTDTFASSLQKIKRAMDDAAGGNDDLAARFDRLGVSVQDADGELRDSWDVFLETIDALGKVRNETERDAIAMDLMGKSASDLNPLIEAGAGKMQELADEAERVGYVLSEEQLESAGEWQDLLDRLTAQTDALKNNIGMVLIETVRLAGGNSSLEETGNAWKNLGNTITGELDTIFGEGHSEDRYGAAGAAGWLFDNSPIGQMYYNVKEFVEWIKGGELEEGFEEIEEVVTEATETLSGATETQLANIEAMYDTELQKIADSAEERRELLEEANAAELKDFQKSQEKQLKAFEKTQSAELKAFQKTQSQRKKEFQAALDAEMDALDEAHKKKLEQINEEYTERIKLVDEDRYKALQAIEGMIADLDKLTEAEEKAEEERKKREAIAEAEDAIARAETAEEREQAEKEYNDLLAEYERERVLAEREAQRQRYENMLLSVNEEYDRRVEEIEKEVAAKEQQAEDEYTVAKTALEEEHAMRQELFDEQMTNELDAFKENQQAQKDAFKETLDLQAKDHEQYLSDKLTREQKELEDEILAEEDAARRKRDIRIQYEQESISTMERLNDDYVKELNKTLTDNLPFLDRGNIDLSGLTQIPKYASGTLRHPGGLAIVGEEGPELVSLPAGSAVFPNSTLRSMGSGDTVNNWYVTVSAADVREFNDIVRLAQTRRQDIRMARTEG